MMTATEFREAMINAMKETIIHENPKMVIRRLQNDNAFVIYIKIKSKDEYDVIRNHIVLIDIITEKSNPGFFRTIKNIIKVINNEEIIISKSNYLLSLFYPVEIKDKKDNVIENLIEFDQSTFYAIGTLDNTPVTNVDITSDDANDEFNIVQMLHTCAKVIRDNNFNEPSSWLCHANKSPYAYFRYGLFLMDNRLADDETLHKVITDDLYGYQITYDKDNRYAKIQNETESIYYKLKCHDESCELLSNGNIDWLHHIALYYTAKASKNSNRSIYLKGEYASWALFYNRCTCYTAKHTAKQYIVPRTWFDFNEIYYYDIKIKNVVCDNCGRNLNPHD